MARPKAPVGAPKAVSGTLDLARRLERLRDVLEAAIQAAEPRDLAPLSTRYQAVITQLAELPAEKEADGIDDLSNARRRRRSSASA